MIRSSNKNVVGDIIVEATYIQYAGRQPERKYLGPPPAEVISYSGQRSFCSQRD